MFLARTELTGRHYKKCNIAAEIWDLVDQLPNVKGISSDVLDCSLEETLYLVFLGFFIVLYAMSVTSVPQIDTKDSDNSKTESISFCSKCCANVDTMDHHCYLICNCVGKKNRGLFLCCLLAGTVNLSYLLYLCGAWAFRSNDCITVIGLLLVVLFLGLLAALLAFQLLLIRNKETTIGFMKKNKGKRNFLTGLAKLVV
ncbi:zinc-finger multi-pass transmembrane protein [Angomonas deanei]|uniref:Palmitoyltransferase n=1 Tax=Angomonas deanei TaxID=59799 RepID=A0A7G2CK12_9TRYP|nr:zinc-finger multi-pass transmembrane protein [Angomonas deanei]CAD2219715.1 DHHC palmitoyltransferase, putative [Angomonas deanei]|eukprot:EPY25361.1 zinc-finger multi-pass transmembrane protein [Angomonas deanei]